MKLTVAICTWNRALLLRQTFERMEQLRPPSGTKWELLVVDNNSTDETQKVLHDFANRLPLRPLFEPRQGLSYARNQAVLKARGEYIIWTDDDVLVNADWLANYADGFARHPDGVIFGGPVEPWFEVPPPPWIIDAFPIMRATFAAVDYGAEEVLLDAPSRLPYGANMAMRMAEQRRYSYDPRLGLGGVARLLGEETDLMQRMLADGLPGYWLPAPRVAHFVPRGRQSLSFVRQWHVGYGRSIGARRVPPNAPLLLGRPRYLYRVLVIAGLRYAVLRLTGARARRWVKALSDCCTCWGMLQAFPPPSTPQ